MLMVDTTFNGVNLVYFVNSLAKESTVRGGIQDDKRKS